MYNAQLDRDTEKRSVRYVFSKQELYEMGTKLASLNQEKTRVEDDKKSAMDQFKARLSTIDAQITEYAQLLSDEWKYKDVEHEILWHTPEHGKKTFKRIDNGETKVEPMDASDFTLFNQRKEDREAAEAEQEEETDMKAVNNPGKLVKLPADKPKGKAGRKKKTVQEMMPGERPDAYNEAAQSAADETNIQEVPYEEPSGGVTVTQDEELSDEQMDELSLEDENHE